MPVPPPPHAQTWVRFIRSAVPAIIAGTPHCTFMAAPRTTPDSRHMRSMSAGVKIAGHPLYILPEEGRAAGSVQISQPVSELSVHVGLTQVFVPHGATS